jgi:ubiquinone/menaquinone biosynthesis C-methylase UbiE
MEINELIICPNCKNNLQIEDGKYLCSNCNSSYEITSNIPVLISHHNSLENLSQKNLAEYFDSKYKNDEDPWNYESSAAEKMKYEFVTKLVNKLNPHANIVLDVACSFGYLSNKLSNVSEKVIGIDVSLNALMKANDKYKEKNITFISAGAENIPFKDNSFDAVILCDGLNGMDLTGVHRENAVKESMRVLKDNGFTIFTDYLKPNQFEGYIDYIKYSNYKIKEVYYLNDRLWYKLKHSFQAFKDNSVFKKFLSSLTAGKALSKISSIFGKSGSNHICIVATRK